VPPLLRRAVGPLVRDLAGALLYRSGITRPARQGAGRLSVVTFHRVLPEAALRDYPLPQIAVTPPELAWFLAHFQAHYTCGALAAVHRRWLDGERPPRPFLAITFDDGQRDNFEHARPALAAAGLAATFFAPLDAVDGDQPLWHDRLGFAAARLLQRERTAALALLGPPGAVERPGAAPVPDAALVGQAIQQAKRLAPGERVALVARLEARLGESARPPWDGLMSWDQLRALARDGHEVGSHSLSHPILTLVDDAQLEREVAGSRLRLEAELQRPCESFCYPNGDCDERVAAAVRQAGYRRAVLTRWGANPAGTDPLRLARLDMQGRHARDRRGRLSAARLAFRMSRLFPGPAA
jgi:peptidoglycan/xylan/chitin deacetylase (PgdA/CDA1 family)